MEWLHAEILVGANAPAAVNRLDRLTSGLMIIPLNADLARSLTKEFIEGSVRKEYVARVKGNFPEYVSDLLVYAFSNHLPAAK